MYKGIRYVRSKDVSLHSIHVNMDCSLIRSYRRWGCDSRIIILTIATTKDVANMSLQVFYISGSCSRSAIIMHHGLRALAYLIFKVHCTPDATTKVVGSVNVFKNVRVASLTNVCLGMTKDVGITSTTKGSIDATIAQIHIGVTSHCALKTACIDILSCWYAVATSRCACNSTL